MVSKIELVKTHIEVENQHDIEAMLATVVDEEPIRDEVAGETYRGRHEVAARYQALWDAFPNFNISPRRFTVDEHRVAMEAIYSGTHDGVFNGHSPTGRSFNLRILVLFTFDHDRIASEAIYLDYASQLRQLGIAVCQC